MIFSLKAYQSPRLMNLQIWTIVCPHLWMLTFPFSPHTLRAPRILCSCLSNRQCGRLILIKKNDKCRGKIKSRDAQFASVKYGAVSDRNKWKDLDLLSEWYIRVINFCKEQNVWIEAALFRTFSSNAGVSPVTLAVHFSPSAHLFQNAGQEIHQSITQIKKV